MGAHRTPRFLVAVGLVALLLAMFSPRASVAEAGPAAEEMARASAAAARGDLATAIHEWSKAEAAYLAANDPAGRIEALLRRAEAFARRGFLPEAISDLGLCLLVSEESGVDGRTAEVEGALGSLLMHSDRLRAEDLLGQSLARAVADRRWAVAASAANNLGNLLALEKQRGSARRAFQESLDYALRAERPLTAATAALNIARLESRAGADTAVETRLAEVLEILEPLPPSSSRNRLRTGVATVLLEQHEDGDVGADQRRYLVYHILSESIRDAEAAGDLLNLAQARGYLGRLYELEGRSEDALALTRQAIFASQGIDEPGLIYRWHWQAGRLLKQLVQIEEAIAASRHAVTDLQGVRADLLRHQEPDSRGFRQATGGVFFELTDLLLRYAAGLDDAETAQEVLTEARATVELFKAVELEDYFQDNCVAAVRAETSQIDFLDARTAAIYPIPLEDRLAIILSVGETLELISVPVSNQEIEQQAIAMRGNLQHFLSNDGYLAPSQSLHEILIAPILPSLEAQGIDTLVVAPDGILRTIPFAALHDGERFLVQDYAVAIVPGLTLLDPWPLPRENVEVFVSALSESVRGWAALPAVNEEVERIAETFDITLLMNEDYVVANVEDEFARQAYNIVHVASHGQFTSDSRDSFLLTYDGKISMDKLETLIKMGRFGDQPVELLTLSACQTAVGDDRAALGLAGAAIKAGARSVMGSLWLLADDATTSLVGAFYDRLGRSQLSKAKALQQAQLALLDDPKFSHPSFWSPFLIIGNWL